MEGDDLLGDEVPDLPAARSFEVQLGAPVRLVAGLIGSVSLLGGVLFWIVAIWHVATNGLSWPGWDVAGFWLLGVVGLPVLAWILCRAAWSGRDRLQEAANRDLAERIDVWSDELLE